MQYTITGIQNKWINGIGHLAGRPVIAVRFAPKGTPKSMTLTGQQLARRIATFGGEEDMQRGCRYVALLGNTRQCDHELFKIVTSKLGKLAYIESEGVHRMSEDGVRGRLPLWNHVALRIDELTESDDPFRIEIFHSVIIHRASLEELARFTMQLEKREFRGERYLVNNKINQALAKRFARTWSVTERVKKHDDNH